MEKQTLYNALFMDGVNPLMTHSALLLLPAPREITRHAGTLNLNTAQSISIDSPDLLFEAQRAQAALKRWAELDWQIVTETDSSATGLHLMLDSRLSAQAYQLQITEDGIRIRGGDAAGVFYGVGTLSQVLQQHGATLPHLAVNDHPEIAVRGVMLDASRDKVPTMETLYALIDRLAGWKINHLQLYLEHTFAYRSHPEVWAKASPFTGEEILEIDAFCRERHIELVPNQNSLGHMERWLKHERYTHLAEKPEGFNLPWGPYSPPTSLNPVDPESIALISSLYDELLPHFTSKWLNVGGDEPWELGQGRSQPVVAEIGEGRVYLNYLLKLYAEVTRRGYHMMFWDDIIVKYPELVPELPKDITAMIWGYEATDPLEAHCITFDGSGIPFYVCAGTSSWNTFAGRTENMIGNHRNAIENSLKYGAVGYLNTDWGDNGHVQTLPVSFMGFAYGAAVSWYYPANRDLDLAQAVSLFAFEDATGIMGRIAYDLGNVYDRPGHAIFNGHNLHNLLRAYGETLATWKAEFIEQGGTVESFREVQKRVREIMQPINQSEMQCSDANLIKAEYQLAADFITLACERGLLLFGESHYSEEQYQTEMARLLEHYEYIWMTRNRPGGFMDSMERFLRPLEDLSNR